MQKKTPAEYDLLKEIAALKNYTEVSEMLYSITDPLYHSPGPLTVCLNRMIGLYKGIKFKYGELWARKEMADLHLREGKVKLAETEMVQLIKEHERTKLPDQAQYYDLLSGIYLNGNDYKNALATA